MSERIINFFCHVICRKALEMKLMERKVSDHFKSVFSVTASMNQFYQDFTSPYLLRIKETANHTLQVLGTWI